MAEWNPQEQISALADQKLNMKMGVRKELKTLPNYLVDGEEVVNMSDGMYDGTRGLVFCTDRRVGFLAAGMSKSKFEDFPYERVSSVQHSTGMMYGEITIFAAGNKAHITQLLKARAAEIADYVRERAGGGTATATPAAPAPASEPDAADQIRKLADLRDQGILTEEEFSAKKQQILGI